MYYAVTERMKSLYASKQRQTVNISVELKDGSTADDFVITEADILSDSFSIDRYCATGENLEIGSAVAAEIKFDLNNSSGKFDEIQLGGAKLFVRLGIKDGDDANSPTEFIDCGYYTVDKNPKPLAIISVAALDNMMKFDKDVEWDKFIFPMSVKRVLEISCEACGVTLSSFVSFENLPNGSYEISSRPESANITYRQLVQWIAEITGTCAWVDWNGHLRFSWYENTDIVITPSDRFYSTTEDAITVTGVQIIESEEEKHFCGEEGFVFNIEGNELIQNNYEMVAENLRNALAGFTYVPFESVGFPMPYVYPLDVISFKTLKGEVFNTVITAHVYSLNGTSSLKASGENKEQQNYAVSSPFTKRETAIIKQLRNENKKQLNKVEKDTLDLNNSLIYALGLHSTKVKHVDGSETQYLHSKETLEDCVEGDVIFCLNSGGFGVCTTGWNDGEPIFENGFDAKSGKAIWKYLSANTISADHISAGRITSSDGKTFFDLDKGCFGTRVTEEGSDKVKYEYAQDADGVYLKTGLAMTYEEFIAHIYDSDNTDDMNLINLTEKEQDEFNKIKEECSGDIAKMALAFLVKSFEWWRRRINGYEIVSYDEKNDCYYYLNFAGNKMFFSDSGADLTGKITAFSLDGIQSNKRLKIDAPGIDLPVRLLTGENDCDTLFDNGDYIYYTADRPQNAPYENAALIKVEGGNSNESQKVMTATRYGDAGYSKFRQLHNSKWGPWCVHWAAIEDTAYPGCYYRKTNGAVEWINPPLVANKEYRTVERYEGHPVYVKVVDFGNLPNKTSKTVSTGINGRNSFYMEFDIHMSNGSITHFPYVSTGFNAITRAYLEPGGSLFIETNADMSAYTANVIVKYTKS